jgi:hypothetical protein
MENNTILNLYLQYLKILKDNMNIEIQDGGEIFMAFFYCFLYFVLYFSQFLTVFENKYHSELDTTYLK